MKFDQMRDYLDRAAALLDRKGHNDLADKIDVLSARLAKATPRSRRVIALKLEAIDREVARRDRRERVAARRPARRPARRLARRPARRTQHLASERTARPSRIAAMRRRQAIRERLKARKERTATHRPSRLSRISRSLRQRHTNKSAREERSDRLARRTRLARLRRNRRNRR